MTLLHRRSAQVDKKFALDKEPELWAEMEKIKGTYNGKGVLFVKILTGCLQIGAGAVGIVGAFSAASVTFQAVSGGIKSGADAGGIFAGILGEGADKKRTAYQFMQGVLQRKQEDRSRAATDSAGLAKEALRNLNQIEDQAHSTASRIMESRG